MQKLWWRRDARLPALLLLALWWGLSSCGSRTDLDGFRGPVSTGGNQLGTGGVVGTGGGTPSGGASGSGGMGAVDSCPPGSFDPDGGPAMACQFGTDQDDAATGVGVDEGGNVYVTGSTYGPLNGPSNGSGDAFVRKYSPRGVLRWGYQGSSTEGDTGLDLVLDAVGHVHVLVARGEQTALLMFDLEGTLISEQILGGSYYDLGVDAQGTRYVTRPVYKSDGASNAELTRLDPDGSANWTITLNGGLYEWPSGLVALPTGDVVVSGSTDGDLFGDGSGNTEAFVARYTADGSLVWGVQFRASYLWTSPSSVALDSAENVYVAGQSGGDNQSPSDAFIARVSSDGQVEWATVHGTDTFDYHNAVAVDAFDRVTVVGTTEGLLGNSDAGWGDAFIARVSPAGDLGPVIQFGTSAVDSAYALAASPDGAWFVVGSTQGSFDGSTTAGGYDAYILRVEPF